MRAVANTYCAVLLPRVILALRSLLTAVSLDWGSLSKMGWLVGVSTWARYLNRRMQRERKMSHKAKEHMFMKHAQVMMRERRRGAIRRIIDRPLLADTDVELGLQLCPLVTASKGELSLIRLLDTYELAKAIASQCHHTDFKNLMLVSKGVRFATQNCMSNRILKSLTCNPDIHRGGVEDIKIFKDCWGCGVRICPGCSSLHEIPQDKAFHVGNCLPYCSPCFRSRCCSPRIRTSGCYRERRSRWLPDACFGHGFRPIHPDIQFSGWIVPKFEFERVSRILCTLCRSMSWEEIAARQGWRGWTIRGGNLGYPKSPGVQCKGCEKDILAVKGQQVWWACGACGSECADEFHEEEQLVRFQEKGKTGSAAR